MKKQNNKVALNDRSVEGKAMGTATKRKWKLLLSEEIYDPALIFLHNSLLVHFFYFFFYSSSYICVSVFFFFSLSAQQLLTSWTFFKHKLKHCSSFFFFCIFASTMKY